MMILKMTNIQIAHPKSSRTFTNPTATAADKFNRGGFTAGHLSLHKKVHWLNFSKNGVQFSTYTTKTTRKKIEKVQAAGTIDATEVQVALFTATQCPVNFVFALDLHLKIQRL